MTTVPTSIRSILEELRASAHKNAEAIRKNLEQLDDLLEVPEDESPEEAGKATTSAVIEHGPISINDEELKAGAYSNRFQPIEQGKKRTLKIRTKGAKNALFCSVEVPEGRSLRHMHVVSTKATGVVVLTSYAPPLGSAKLETFALAAKEEWTCVRCGDSITCGINPTCGDVPR